MLEIIIKTILFYKNFIVFEWKMTHLIDVNQTE